MSTYIHIHEHIYTINTKVIMASKPHWASVPVISGFSSHLKVPL